MPPDHENNPGLYGISEKNSNRHGDSLWGKNQFNSTFPLSLCLYLRDKGIDPVAVVYDDDRVAAREGVYKMGEVVGEAGEGMFYGFEERFSPYSKFLRNEVKEKIDLVVSKKGKPRIPLEVKLTVVPDKSTSVADPSEWAPEVVLRPVSSAHAMMGVASSLKNPENAACMEKAIKVLRPVCNGISSWENETEILSKSGELHEAILKVIGIAEGVQKPFLLQPIWRTQGQSFDLCDQCFDMFVWSDLAVMAIPAMEQSKKVSRKITRGFREIARHTRSLYNILKTDDFDYQNTYKRMALGSQTDKSYSLPGIKSIRYLRHDRLKAPILHKDALHEIILNGGEEKLKPERRFDAAVVLEYDDNR